MSLSDITVLVGLFRNLYIQNFSQSWLVIVRIYVGVQFYQDTVHYLGYMYFSYFFVVLHIHQNKVAQFNSDKFICGFNLITKLICSVLRLDTL